MSKDKEIRKLVFQMNSDFYKDADLGLTLFHFAEDEGYSSAISKVEQWNLVIEEMIEATNMDKDEPLVIFLSNLKEMISSHLTNLVIQNGVKSNGARPQNMVKS